jgi:hypothetical protein
MAFRYFAPNFPQGPEKTAGFGGPTGDEIRRFRENWNPCEWVAILLQYGANNWLSPKERTVAKPLEIEGF